MVTAQLEVLTLRGLAECFVVGQGRHSGNCGSREEFTSVHEYLVEDRQECAHDLAAIARYCTLYCFMCGANRQEPPRPTETPQRYRALVARLLREEVLLHPRDRVWCSRTGNRDSTSPVASR